MDCAQYLTERLELLEKRLAHINKLAAEDALPDATITATGLTSIPKNAKSFVDKATALLPHVNYCSKSINGQISPSISPT